MKKKGKLLLIFGLIGGVALLVVPMLFPNSGGHVRATCWSDISDQLREYRGVFDVTVTDSIYEPETNSCQYTIAINEVLKSSQPITLKEFQLSERIMSKSCIGTQELSIQKCALPDHQYLLITKDGIESELDEIITINPRFNYFQPIEKKSEVETFLKKEM